MISEQLSVSVAELQASQSQINSTVLGIDATVIEIDGRVFKMEQNGKIIHSLIPVINRNVGRQDVFTFLPWIYSDSKVNGL